VKNTIEALVVLQDRDRKMLKYMREARDIPERKRLIEVQVEDSQTALTAAQEKLKENLATQKTLDIEIDSIKGRIAKYKTQQLSVKNNDEYRALENQIVMARKEIEKFENREISLMESGDSIKAEAEAAKQRLADAEDRVKAEKEALDRRLANTTEDIERMKSKRAALIADIDKDVLRVYTRIMNNKKDYAIVSVDRDTCGGCHMTLTPQTIHDARSNQKLVTCSYCGRLLYWDQYAG
jgi:predicted  nucleic acid-binding Zn-ribbon protein